MSNTNDMRPIVEHHDSAINNTIGLYASMPGPGGAPETYRYYLKTSTPKEGDTFHQLDFARVGQSGVTNELLLAIVRDRLKGFQDGPFACSENAQALSFVNGALALLKERTKRRLLQGTEGKMQERTASDIRVNAAEDVLDICGTKFTLSPLQTTWKAWNELEASLRKLMPLRPTEWQVLEEIPTTVAGKNGLCELRQALAHAKV